MSLHLNRMVTIQFVAERPTIIMKSLAYRNKFLVKQIAGT